MHIKRGKLSPKHNKVLHHKSDEYPITIEICGKKGNALRRKEKCGGKDTLRNTHTEKYKQTNKQTKITKGWKVLLTKI